MNVIGKIKVAYSCNVCSLYRVSCQVSERTETEIDIEDWLKKITLEIAKDHRTRSPTCLSEKLSELLIPFAGSKRIGEKPRS